MPQVQKLNIIIHGEGSGARALSHHLAPSRGRDMSTLMP